MLVVGLLLSTLLGFSLLHFLSFRFSVLEKVGLSFLLGIALQTFLMLLMDAVGLKLNVTNIWIVTIGAVVLLNIRTFRQRKEMVTEWNKTSFRVPELNFVWLVFIAVSVYLEYMNFEKCMFYPTFDRDGLAAFDTIGWIISQEHTLRNLSIFDSQYVTNIHDPGSSITYIPMLQLSYAYVYLLGAETSKLIPALSYLSFLIAFYAVIRRFIGHTGAAVATFFVLVTPEMLAFSSLSITNNLQAVYASLGGIYIVLWLKERKRYDFWLASLLIAANVWMRLEGIVFVASAGIVLLIDALKEKKVKFLLLYSLVSIAPLLVWVIYMKFAGIYAEGIVSSKLFWDPEKMGVIWTYLKYLLGNGQYYGLTFTLFWIAILANIWFLIKKKDQLYLLLQIGLGLFFYVLIIYQIEYKWDSIENVLGSSAKRFLFCFIPMVWCYIFTSHWGAFLFRKLEGFLSFRKEKTV